MRPLRTPEIGFGPLRRQSERSRKTRNAASRGQPWGLRMSLSGLLGAILMGAPANRLCPSFHATWRQRFSVSYLKWRFPLVYALWRELCSLPFRISEIHERGLADNGLNLEVGLRVLPDGTKQWDADFQSRSEDIQNLQRDYPWTTLLDHLLYLEGRRAGWRSCSRSAPVYTPQWRTRP